MIITFFTGIFFVCITWLTNEWCFTVYTHSTSKAYLSYVNNFQALNEKISWVYCKLFYLNQSYYCLWKHGICY